MSDTAGFDINITLSDSAQGWAVAYPIQSSSFEGTEGADEFDLDVKYSGAIGDPPTNEPLRGAGFFSITCGNTCQVGVTCTCTCGNTCGITCGNTCQVGVTCTCTCGNTCGVTCGAGLTCGCTYGKCLTNSCTCSPTCQILQSCTCTCDRNRHSCFCNF
jgi:hypothetical protein